MTWVLLVQGHISLVQENNDKKYRLAPHFISFYTLTNSSTTVKQKRRFNLLFVTCNSILKMTWVYMKEHVHRNSLTFLLLFPRRFKLRIGILLGSRSHLNRRRCLH